MCKVLGAQGVGKSAFLQAFLGHSLGVRIMEAPPPTWELKGAGGAAQRTLGPKTVPTVHTGSQGQGRP